MKGIHPQNRKEDLFSYYQDNLLLKQKIAFLSVSDLPFPDWTEKMMLIWEYAQLMSQGLLLYSNLGGHSLLEKAIIYLFKLVNPSSFLEFKEESSFAWSIIILMLVITGLKYALMGYLLYISSWNKQGNQSLITIWRWLFRFQARFTCFFLTSFWARAILSIPNEGSDWVQAHKVLIIVLLNILIAGEYVISFLIEMQFCDMLPSKNFLSGKNNEMQLLTLAQKMTIQILQLALKSSLLTKLWIYSVINLLFSVWRIKRFLVKLPLYKSKALYLQGNLASLVATLHTVNIVVLIVTDLTTQFVIILWIIIGLLGARISQGILQKNLFKLLLTKDAGLLVHKMIFSKELYNFEKVPNKTTAKYHFTHMFRAIEKFEFTRQGGGMFSEDSQRKSIEDLLLKCQDQEPLIRIYITKLWFKQFGMCFKVLRIAADVLAKPWSKEYTSYILLLNSIQKISLKARKKDILNLTGYIDKQKLVKELKTEMIRLAQMKTIICQNILNKTCDVGEIFDQAQLAWKSRIKIDNKIDTWLRNAPESWTAPLLLFSIYSLILEYSTTKCQKYQELYSQRFLKNEKHFESPKIMKENLYQESNIFLILGGLNSEIKFCSKSIEEVCGDEKKYYTGLQVTKLFTQSMHSFYQDLFKRIVDQGETNLMQKEHRVILSNRKGYILEASLCLWIHPNISSETLYLNMILRPMNSRLTEFLVIKKNGDIEGATKDLSLILNLRMKSSININVLSEELAAANEVLNSILLTQRSQREFQFSAGKDVEVTTLTNLKAKFHCRMTSFSEDLPFTKLIFFTKLKTRNKMVADELISNRPEIDQSARKRGGFALLTTKRIETNMGTERNLLTNLETTQQDLLTSPRADKSKVEGFELMIEDENDVQDFISTTTLSLKAVQEGRDLKEIKKILEKKTFSDLFKMLNITFYVVVILALGTQLVSMQIFNSTMDDLVVKKNLLNYAQTRAYYACKMPFAIETPYLLSTGIDIYSYYANGVAFPPATLNRISYQYQLELAAANNEIKKLISQLEGKEIYQELFKKDVRIIGSIYDLNDEGFSKFTSFQAVEQLGVPLRYLKSAPDPVAANTTAAYLFLKRNALGDFLVKNEQVTVIFKESVINQRNTLDNFIWLCIILNPLALTGVCLTLNLMIWRQYLQDEKYFQAFIKLDPNFISSIAESMKDFRLALCEERSFEDRPLLKLFWDQSWSLENRTIENHHSRHNSQLITLTKTKKKYFLFALQMGTYMAILIVVLLWNFITMKSSMNVIYTKQSQLELSNYISESTNVDFMGMVEMYVSNNTLNVSGLSPLAHTRKAVQELGKLRSDILSGFQEYDGSYDPIIKKQVFDGQICSMYTESLPAAFCVVLQNEGISTSLVSLSTFFESFMKTQLALYESMHAPSVGELVVGLQSRGAVMSATTSLMSFLAQRLNGVIDEQLSECITNTKNKQALGMIIFTATLMIVSLLIWIQILSKIKETNNNFKKVLQVFPTKLIASSFLLKKFIDKFSTNHVA